MKISRQTLVEQAAATGFRPEALEKVWRLLGLLEAIQAALGLLARRLGLAPQTPAAEHAGISWAFRYPSALGGSDNIKVDLNYLSRVPLWPPSLRDSRPVGGRQARGVLTLDDHELAAGKLTALIARRTSRDLFDAHRLLTAGPPLDPARLRAAFVLYGAMNVVDWRRVSVADIEPATRDLETYLRPLLRDGMSEGADWAGRLTAEYREALGAVLPLRGNEMTFLERLLSEGELEPERITGDADLAARARRHPALLWKRLNVRKHFGLGG